MTGSDRGAGFTLFELTVVLAISALAMSVALPDLRQVIRSHQLKAAASDLFGAVDLTRAQAISRGRQVQLVPADSVTLDWRDGWVVFVDQDRDRRPGAREEVIMRHGPLANGITVDFAFSGQQGLPYIAYNGAGRSCSDTSSMAVRFGTLSLFQGRHTRRIKINMLGRARMCDPARDGVASCAGAAPEP